ncbi:unnamed protein product [Sphagnum jensenii]|uniref:Secreted protein n=1 Tax=Sphagnum jensenii TaxID=128206 RepID=A0ABP0VA32_9BRYO
MGFAIAMVAAIALEITSAAHVNCLALVLRIHANQAVLAFPEFTIYRAFNRPTISVSVIVDSPVSSVNLQHQNLAYRFLA